MRVLELISILGKKTNEWLLDNPGVNPGVFIDKYKELKKELIFPDLVEEEFFKWVCEVVGGLHVERVSFDDWLKVSEEHEKEPHYIDNYIWCEELCQVVKNLISSNRQKRRLLEKRLKVVFKRNKRVLFCTFTFDRLHTLGGSLDIASLSDEELMKIVEDYLKSKGITDYIINYDYHQNGLVHFHAIVGCDYLDENEWSDSLKIGFANVRRIRGVKARVNGKPISTYFCKLSNHCIKASTKGRRVLYSKSLRCIPLYEKQTKDIHLLIEDTLQPREIA